MDRNNIQAYSTRIRQRQYERLCNWVAFEHRSNLAITNRHRRAAGFANVFSQWRVAWCRAEPSRAEPAIQLTNWRRGEVAHLQNTLPDSVHVTYCPRVARSRPVMQTGHRHGHLSSTSTVPEGLRWVMGWGQGGCMVGCWRAARSVVEYQGITRLYGPFYDFNSQGNARAAGSAVAAELHNISPPR